MRSRKERTEWVRKGKGNSVESKCFFLHDAQRKGNTRNANDDVKERRGHLGVDLEMNGCERRERREHGKEGRL